MSEFLVRRACIRDAPQLDLLLNEWLNWKPANGRREAISRAIRSGEILVAEKQSRVIGFIHFVLHEDIIDGALNAFITALYVQRERRGKGVGGELLRNAVVAATKRGATFIETSTLHSRAKAFYERRGFRQATGDIGEAFLELDVTEYLKAQ